MVDRSQPTRLVDCPQPCFVRLRTERKGRWYAARIYHCLGMLLAEIDQRPASPDQVWHGGSLISEQEYNDLIHETNSPRPF